MEFPEFLTVGIIPSPDKDLPNRMKNGNFLPRERILLARIARTVSTTFSHFPWYVVDIPKLINMQKQYINTIMEDKGVKARSLTEQRTPEAKKIRKEMMQKGKDWCPRRGKSLVPRKDEIANNLTSTQGVEQLIVIPKEKTKIICHNLQPRSPDRPSLKYSKGGSGHLKREDGISYCLDAANGMAIEITEDTRTMEMQQKSTPVNSQNLIYWLGDFLAKHSQLQGSVKGLMTPEERSFLKSLGFVETKDPDIFCLKMLKVYYLTTTEKLSRQSLGFSPTSGMIFNGRCLIAKTSVSPRIGKECSLSDILEEKVADKYFLSEKAVDFIIRRTKENKEKGRGFAAQLIPDTEH
jgi:hypothetical protein